jgi:hypothetical protein
MNKIIPRTLILCVWIIFLENLKDTVIPSRSIDTRKIHKDIITHLRERGHHVLMDLLH